MSHIHTSIDSRHLATRGNKKILRTPPPHIISSEEILPRLTGCTLAQLRTNKSPFHNSYIQKITSIPSIPTHTHTHTTHIISSSTAPRYDTRHVVTLGFVDRPRWNDGTAGLMDGLAGWWTSSVKIGLPTLVRVKGMCRQ